MTQLFFVEPSFLKDHGFQKDDDYFYSVHGMFIFLPGDFCYCPDAAIKAANHSAFLPRRKILR
jgi:hypothetical protein